MSITRRNKRRSYSMESRVAEVMGGKRTPLSGGGAMFKGDVGWLNSPIGEYILECKLSERKRKKDVASAFSFKFEWMAKVRRQALETEKIFGATVFRFHGQRKGDYAVMFLTDMLRLPGIVFEQRSEHTIQTSNKSTLFIRPTLDTLLAASYNPDYTPSRAVCVWADDVYVVMTLDTFKELVTVEELDSGSITTEE